MAGKKITTVAFSAKHGISKQWVHELIRQGRIQPPPIRLEGGHRPYLFAHNARILKINELGA
jgi:hypothetical protein